MDWRTEDRADARLCRPAGRIDEASWEAFAGALAAAVPGAPAGRIVIDLADVDYMSSRGLRALTVARREASAAGVVIVLAAPNETMREILAISRYDKLFEVTTGVGPG